MSFNDDFDTELRNERQIGDSLFPQLPALPTDPDPGTFVRKDTLTAKGDLFAATAAAAIGRQAIGTDAFVLTADSTTSTGMKWAANAASPATATYITVSAEAGLSAERVLTGTANQIILTDGGANSTMTLSTPQSIHTGANPTFAGVICSTSGRLSTKVTTPAQIVANTNDYNPGTAAFFRLSTDAARNITGIVAGADGDILRVANVGNFNIVLQNQNAGSAAANRLITGTGADITLTPDQTAEMVYDITSQKWRVFA